MFVISVILFVVLILYYKWRFTYWRRRGVPFVEPTIPFGNLQNPLSPNDPIGVIIKHLYDELKKRKCRYGGVYFFTRPIHLLVNLQCVQDILVKDFKYFTERGLYYNEKDDPIGTHFFTLGGTRWRNIRVPLSPFFSSGRIKEMFPLIVTCGEALEEKMETLSKSHQPFDTREIFACFNTDVIGSCGFNLKCNTLKNENSPFRRFGKQFSIFNRLRLSQITFAANFPEEARMLKIRAVPKETSDFFSDVFGKCIRNKENSSDYMQLLLHSKLKLQEVIAQCFALFIPAVENPSTVLMWALYELVDNPAIQERLRKEVYETLERHRGKVTYEGLQEMKYMDQVLNETMRKYPVIPFITRQCTKRYKIPGDNVTLEKGMRVVVSIMGIHYDEEYYPEPYKFDPDRFNEENYRLRPKYAHIPFGEGPRNCFGMRFGLVAMKVSLIFLLKKYKFTLNEKCKKPLKFATESVSLFADGGVWMDVEKV